MVDWLRKSSLMNVLMRSGDERSPAPVPAEDDDSEDTPWLPTVPMWSATRMDEPSTLRAADLRRLSMLQARGDSVFQYIVDTAARIGHTPLAGISLWDGSMVYFKAAAGVGLMRLPVQEAPCWLAMNSHEHVTVFHALSTDLRFAGGQLTSGPDAIQYYAGARLWGGPDVPLGTVWVADRVQRLPTSLQLRTLELLARQTTLLLESAAHPVAA